MAGSGDAMMQMRGEQGKGVRRERESVTIIGVPFYVKFDGIHFWGEKDVESMNLSVFGSETHSQGAAVCKEDR